MGNQGLKRWAEIPEAKPPRTETVYPRGPKASALWLGFRIAEFLALVFWGKFGTAQGKQKSLWTKATTLLCYCWEKKKRSSWNREKGRGELPDTDS